MRFCGASKSLWLVLVRLSLQSRRSLVHVGPQSLVQTLERGPVLDVSAPTSHHELEERRRTERRSVQEDLSSLVPEELSSVLYHLFVRQQAVGLLLTQSEDLPQSHTKRPHVTGRRELTQ